MLPREFRLPNELVRVVSRRGLLVSSDLLQIKFSFNNRSVSRFSFIIAKKTIKKATVRNRNKRWLRNAVLDSMKLLHNSIDAVVILKKHTTELNKDLITQDLNTLFQHVNSHKHST